MIIIWAPSSSPQTGSYGNDTEDLQYEKEHWKARTVFRRVSRSKLLFVYLTQLFALRCTTMQVYDLAWSPTGEYIIAGSTDNTARVFAVNDGMWQFASKFLSFHLTSSTGSCVQEIAEHSHFVQGVAWDPMNEYIATQSSDRSMHVYSINTKQGGFEVHAIGRNTRMPYQHRHSRTPSTSGHRPRPVRRESVTSDAESVVTSMSELRSEAARVDAEHAGAPLTPATSIASTPAAMFPPPSVEKATSSRRSSFSGSNAPSSPAHHGRYGRSPSPMPALPAIRSLPPSSWTSVRLYGDESFTNFFRRLTFSPDGGLLLTPAGQFEDPSVTVVPVQKRGDEQQPPSRGRKGNPADAAAEADSASCVYIYTRANFARAPVAQLPGHKKPSVAVKFSPVLYELRSGLNADPQEMKRIAVEVGREENVAIDLIGSTDVENNPFVPIKQTTPAPATPSHSQAQTMPSPALSAVDSLRPPTPGPSQPQTPAVTPAPAASGVFALPYRMLFAVATMDTVTIHDTQQAGPVCLLTKLHYDEFTDMTWYVPGFCIRFGPTHADRHDNPRSPDGQCLMLSSRDGYCTLVVFDEILPAHTTQQHNLQLQSIANHHSLNAQHSQPHIHAQSHSQAQSQSHSSMPPALGLSLPSPSPSLVRKRSEPPLTPAGSQTEEVAIAGPSSTSASGAPPAGDASTSTLTPEPPKKRRRVALTRVGDLDS